MTTYTDESLETTIFTVVSGSHNASYDDVLESLFGNEAATLSNSLVKHIRELYVKHQKLIVQNEGKNYIATFVKNMEQTAIDHFQKCIDNKKFQNFFGIKENIECRMEHLKELKADKPVYKFFIRYFQNQLNAYVECEIEQKFRNELMDLLRDGSIGIETWKKFAQWYKNGNKLSEFLKIKWIPLSSDTKKDAKIEDVFLHNVVKLATKIKTPEFVENAEMSHMLKSIFVKYQITSKKDKIHIEGNTIFADDRLVTKIQNQITNEVKKIEIYAKHCCGLYTDLLFPEKNLIIATKTLKVWNACQINLSGKGYPSKSRKAKNATNVSENGADGADGRPGKSSGNLHILADNIINANLLNIELNGGRGEDGEDGGDGYNGQDGKITTKEEIEEVFPKFREPFYFVNWVKPLNYNPGKDWKNLKEFADKAIKKCVYKEFTDSYDRKLSYSYARISNHWFQFDDYHTFVLIVGGPGERGTCGGANGVGGEGGYRGDCWAINPNTNEKFSLKVTSSSGQLGKNGNVGKPGISGKKGNDRAMTGKGIVAILGARHYEKEHFGDNEHTLKVDYHSKDERYCYSGYEEHVKENSFAWLEFTIGSECQKSVIQTTSERSTRKQCSEAVAQEVIMTDQVIEQMETLYDDAAVFVQRSEFVNVDNIEEESTINETEQIFMLRPADEIQINHYTTENQKNIPALQVPTTTDTAQDSFNFFTTEIEENDRQNNHLKNDVVLQNQVIDDAKLQLKLTMTKYRNEKATMAVQTFLTCEVFVDTTIKHMSIIERVKKGQVISLSKENLETLTKMVTSKTNDYYAKKDELRALHSLIKTLDPELKKCIEKFRKPEFVWCNGQADKYINKLAKESDNNYDEQPWLQPATNDELSFTSFVQMLDSKAMNNIQKGIQLLKDYLENNDEAVKKYEKLPETNDTEFDAKIALFVIKAYFIAYEVLPFNRMLQNCNKLARIEREDLVVGFVNDIDDPDFNNLITQIENNLDVTSNLCDQEMRKKQITSLAVQYLISLKDNKNIACFVSSDYKMIREYCYFKAETASEETQLIWIDGDQAFEIVVDTDYSDLIEAQNFVIEKEKSTIESMITSDIIPKQLESFFPSELQSSVTEWVESYKVVTKYNLLINFLSARFFVDGCHLSFFELQFVLSTFTFLHTNYRANLDFLLIMLSSVSQTEFVNILLFVRLCYRYEKRLSGDPNIWKSIGFINDVRLKIIFGLNMAKHRNDVPIGILHKIILMLQNVKTESDKFEKLSMETWIDIAKKQTWSESVLNFEEFGTANYYVDFLENKGYKAESSQLRQLLQNVKYVPEFYLAHIVSTICHHGFQTSNKEKYIQDYENIFKKGDTWKCPNLKRSHKHALLITDEKMQQDFCKTIGISLNSDSAENRNIDDLERLVIVQDDPKNKPQNTVKDYCDCLKKMDKCNLKEMNKCDKLYSECKYLLQFDQYLNELFGFKLRQTQKMAVLCAVGSEKHVIEQVNTGEGKTFIIAAIAVIRCLRDNQSVDIITSSPVLAERDAKDMKKLYEKFGLTVGHNCSESTVERQKAYKNNIVYGDMGRFQRDYLLHTFYEQNILGKRTRDVVIVDEVDNMLLDNGNNILYLSHNVPCIDILKSMLIYILRKVHAPIFDEDKNSLENISSQFETDTMVASILKEVYGRFLLEDAFHCVDENKKQLVETIFNFLGHEKIIDADGNLSTISKANIQSLEPKLTQKFTEQVAQKLVTSILKQECGKFSIEDVYHCVDEEQKELAQKVHSFLTEENIIDTDGYLLTTSKAIIQNLRPKLTQEFSEQLAHKFEAVLLIAVEKKCEFALPAFLRPYIKIHLREFVESCKKSLYMNKDNEYVVDINHTDSASNVEPVITIIDNNTGADLPSTQWNGGLQQFLQFKHGCKVSPLSLKAVFVSNVAYLNGYKVINGLSGTLGSEHESKTLIDLYGAGLIRIPTFQPRKFCELAPILTTDATEWFKCIYKKINDQISVGRSLLIICDSIAQVEQIEKELKQLYANEKNKSNVQKECFENVVKYTRSTKKFEFDKNNKLLHGRVILATILAGRGTDIQLSQKLIENRGLHVITAFIPKNTRIEEQAFGRTARAGQPGSAQIIALVRKNDSVLTPSIFQFKMIRDNAEVQRLAGLKVFYDYHTKIEEECLEKFHRHCSEVFKKAYSAESGQNKIQSPEEVVYFALLDKWALWLDEQGPFIDQCAKNNNEEERERQKADIIISVTSFLEIHQPNVEEAQNTWLDFPQSLITLGLHALFDKNVEKAEELFNKVIESDIQFAAEAYYYKACICMPSYKIAAHSLINVAQAEKYFSFARTLYSQRLSACKKESYVVMQFVEFSNKNSIKSSGFENQHASMVNNISTIIRNIDWIIGIPCTEKMFVDTHFNEATSKKLYDTFVNNFVIAPSVYVNHNPEPWMLQELHDIYGMSNNEITTAINKLKQNAIPYYRNPDIAEIVTDSQPTILPKNNDNAYRIAIRGLLPNQIHLANRQSFFIELFNNGVIKNVMHLKYANPNHLAEVRIALEEQKQNVQPVTLPLKGHFMVLNNSVKNDPLYYKVSDIASLKNNRIESQMLDEFIGEISLDSLMRFSYFKKFDDVTAYEMADYFEISLNAADWILQTMEMHNILEQKKRFTPDEQLWKLKIECFLTDSNTNQNVKNSESTNKPNLIQKYATILHSLYTKQIQHLSKGFIKEKCHIEDEEELNDLYQLLQTEKLIQNVFRLKNRLNVSCLPQSIADTVELYLTNKFSYFFELDCLCEDIRLCDDTNDSVTFHSIYLPQYPYKEYFDALLRSGFIMPQRIVTKEFQNLDKDCYKHFDRIRSTIIEYSSKLQTKTEYNLQLIPLKQYFIKQNITVNTELKFMSERGLKVVMAVAEDTSWWSSSTIIIGGVTEWCKKCIQAISRFTNWAASGISKQVNKVIDGVVTKVAESYTATKNYATSTEIYKMVSRHAQATGDYIKSVTTPVLNRINEFKTAKILEIANKAAIIGNKIRSISVGMVTGIAAIGTVIAAIHINVLKFIHRIMSAWVTAVYESYEYYNQCRTNARKIGHEVGVDEYTILRTHIDADESSSHKDLSDDSFQNILKKHLEATHKNIVSRLKEKIEEVIYSVFEDNYIVKSEDNNITRIQEFVNVASCVVDFKQETKEYYVIKSYHVRTVFLYLIGEFVVNNAPLESMEMPKLDKNISFESMEGIIRNVATQYAKVMGIEKNEQSKENYSKVHQDKLIKNLTALLIQQVSNSCYSIYVTTIIDSLSNHIAQLRKPVELPEMTEFDNQDKNLKYELSLYNAQVMQKNHNVVVLHELVCSMQTVIENKNVLKTAIKYSFPLSPNALKLILPALNKIMKTSFFITVNDKDKESYGDAEETLLKMNTYHDYIFITIADYQKYKQVDTVVDKNSKDISLYATICSVVNSKDNKQIKNPETFRQDLINEL